MVAVAQVVTLDALEPFRCPTRCATPHCCASRAFPLPHTSGSAGKQEEPEPLPYLRDPKYSSYDIKLEVALQNESVKEPAVVTRSNMKHLYWTIGQQLTHHTVTGCNMQPGDLLGTGTISGEVGGRPPAPTGHPTHPASTPPPAPRSPLRRCRSQGPGEYGSMLELSWKGSKPLTLPDGSERKFLKDGDNVIMTGYCEGEGYRVGFGTCDGVVLPAHPME